MADDSMLFGAEQSIERELAARGPLPPRDALELIASVSRAVESLHARNLVHRAINSSTVGFDDQHRVQLTPPGPAVEFGGPKCDADSCPLELQTPVSVRVPAELSDARAAIGKSGVRLDPIRIDIYQLGSLLCRLLTAEGAPAYLRSPRVKAAVPVSLQPLVDRALGYTGTSRFAHIGTFLAAIEQQLLELDEREPEPASSPPAADDQEESGFTQVDRETPLDADTTKWRPGVSSHYAEGDQAEEKLPFEKLGHYELVGKIGHGGMGDVYKGYERALDRFVAIKVLPRTLARQTEFVRRFHAEASAAARLSHPNIIQIHFIGEDQGQHFFAMQHVEGDSLAQLLSKRSRLSVSETLAIVEQVLLGLAVAHQQGMVHRDIKPGNILIDRKNRRSLLTDFGLVKSVEGSGGLTASGSIMGTVDYISPEQARGQPADARSDLYSVGVLIHQMLSGRLPFEADSATAVIFQHVYEQPPPLREAVADAPESLAALVARLLAKSPDDRPSTAQQVLEDLRAVRADLLVRSQDEPTGASQEQVFPSAVLDTGPRAQTAIVLAPNFDDAPSLPDGLSKLAATGWWARTRDRALGLFQVHAPELAAQLQNTVQQVAGAVALYQSRRDELERLVAAAESAFKEIDLQRKAHHAAAADAERRAEETEDDQAIQQAVREKEELQHTADELQAQLAEQDDQLQTIRLKLAQVNATLRQLKSQRDLLNARLKVAQARYDIDAGKPRRRRRRILIAAAAIAAATCVIVAAVIVGKLVMPDRPSSSDTDAFVEKMRAWREMVRANDGYAIPLDSRVLSIASNWKCDDRSSQMSFVTSNEAGEVDVYRFRAITAAVPEGGAAHFRLFPHTRLSGHLKRVNQVAVSPDGVLVASGSDDKTIRIWHFSGDTKRRELVVLKGHSQLVTAVQFSPDSRLLLSGSRDGTVRLWDWRLKKELSRFDVGGRAGVGVSSLAWSRDAQLFVVGLDRTSSSSDPDLTGMSIWTLEREQRLHSFSVSSPPEKVAFAFDGTTVLSQAGGAMQIWDVSKREHVAQFGESVVAADIDMHSGRVLIGHADHSVALWDSATGSRIATFPGHQAEITSVLIRPDGLMGITASADNTMRLWNLPPPSGQLHVFPGSGVPVRDVAFSPDGVHAAYALDSGVIGMLELERLSPSLFYGGEIGNVSVPLSAVRFSPDGRTVLYATAQRTSEDNWVGVRPVERRTYNRWYPAKDIRGLRGHTDRITAAEFSRDGRTAATGSVDGTVRIWSVLSESEVASLDLGVAVNGIALAPHMTQVLVASNNKTVLLWDWAELQEVRQYSGHGSTILSVAVSGDGRRVVAGGADQTIRVWDFETGKPLTTLAGHGGRVNAVAVSDWGDFVLSGGDDATVRYWDVKSGKEIRRFLGHVAPIHGVAISPGGDCALSAGEDGSVQLWRLPQPGDDVSTGQP